MANAVTMNNTALAQSEAEEMDLASELAKDLEDEGSDHEKYMKLADAADEKYPCRGYGAILRDIAREEAVHHKHIKMILDDMHVPMEG